VRGLEDELDRLARETQFSGVVQVDVGDRVELCRGYGLADRAHCVANGPETQFGTASGTKGLTALAVVRLIEEGRLDLATTARSVLGPDLPLIGDDVTVEQLLAHRSGIGDFLDEEAGYDVDDYVLPVPVHQLLATEDYLAVLDGHPTKFPPDSRFGYCNGGYVVLALIAERVGGAPFHDQVHELCDRAGMSDTRFLRSDELPGRAALGYMAAEGLWRSLFAGRIVAPEWVTRMIRPRSSVPSESMRYGLGFWLHETGDQVMLEGCDAGVSFRTVHDPGRDLTHTVLSNTAEGAWPVTRRLDELLAAPLDEHR
jgi:CubicO group peptidase (beta-lactamase class C family)